MQNKSAQKQKRARRVRVRLKALSARPRLSIFRSNRHIYAQIIDDAKGETLASASSAEMLKGKKTRDAKKVEAKAVGELIGKKAKEARIASVVADRGAYRYHGRVKELIDGARKSGLNI